MATACGFVEPDDAAGTVPLPVQTTSVITLPPSTAPPTTVTDTVPNSEPAPEQAPIPAALEGFPIATITLDGQDWRVAVADTADLRGQGLRNIDDLGPLDGMLFIMERERSATFDMGSVPISLDIAFFAPDGALVDRFTMVPCEEDPCPGYTPVGPFLYAIEAELGGLDFLSDDSMIDVGTLAPAS